MGLPKYIGSFEVVRLLGAGGMGEVFLARDPDLDRYVAVKRLLSTHSAPSERIERFRREAKIAARLDHPSIVRIYGMLDDEGSQCIVMEYVKGKNLREFMNKSSLSVAQVIPLAYRIAEAMAEAHDHNIVHRDLKSENVLITRSGQVKVTDFGIAKMLDEDTMTAEGALVGTYRAMSPEQVLGKPIDRRSDMFSFGTLLYEALSGQTPFQADTPFITLQRIVHGSHRPLAELVPDLPESLGTLIDQLLAKDPLHRPRDFHDILSSLVDIRNDILGHGCHGSVIPEGHPPLFDFDDTVDGEDEDEPGSEPDDSGSGDDGDDDPPPPQVSSTVAAVPHARSGQRARTAGELAPAMGATEQLSVSGDSWLLGERAAATGGVGKQAARSAANEETAPGEEDAELEGRGEQEAGDGDDAEDELTPIEREPGDAVPEERAQGDVRAGQATALSVRRKAAFALAGAALVGLSGFLLWGLLVPAPVDVSPVRVAILEPTVTGGPPGQQLLIRDAVRRYLGRAVGTLQGVEVERYYRVEQAWDDLRGEAQGGQPSLAQLAENLEVSDVLTADVECDDDLQCTVAVQRITRSGVERLEGRQEFVINSVQYLIESTLGEAVLGRFYPTGETNRAVLPTKDPHLQLQAIQDVFFKPQLHRDFGTIQQRLDALREQAGDFLALDDFEAELLRIRATEEENSVFYERAKDHCDGALDRASDSARLMARCSTIRVVAGDDDDIAEARLLLDRMKAQHPNSRWTNLAQGLWHSSVDVDLAEARRRLENAEKRERSWTTLETLVHILIDQGQMEDAAKKLDELITMRPSYRSVMFLRGKLALRRGDAPCAAEYLKTLVDQNGGTFYWCAFLGEANQLLGEYPSAAEAYGCALSKSPNVSVEFNRAENLMAMGDDKNARAGFRKLAEKQLRGRWMQLAVAAYLLALDENRSPAAEQRLLEELATEVESATADNLSIYYVATSYAVLKKRDRAKELVVRLLNSGDYPVEYFRFPWFDEVRKDLALDDKLLVRFEDSKCHQVAVTEP